ncbi:MULTISPECIES: SAM hydroxide adenosyltransferase [unclassified Burkholderia]|uniref:SAM hydroxide adenosyltransferase n=1 Tax=unclassified Burkholderia TaxID=2613784 RepID=UPI002AB319B3|nr:MULTISPECIES: SAM hydroxide adenosyltransferase [unclassified Burkholderia]
MPKNAPLAIAARDVTYARVPSDAPEDQAFWYENSIGLVEIAVSRGCAAPQLGVHVGDPVHVTDVSASGP